MANVAGFVTSGAGSSTAAAPRHRSMTNVRVHALAVALGTEPTCGVPGMGDHDHGSGLEPVAVGSPSHGSDHLPKRRTEPGTARSVQHRTRRYWFLTDRVSRSRALPDAPSGAGAHVALGFRNGSLTWNAGHSAWMFTGSSSSPQSLSHVRPPSRPVGGRSPRTRVDREPRISLGNSASDASGDGLRASNEEVAPVGDEGPGL